MNDPVKKALREFEEQLKNCRLDIQDYRGSLKEAEAEAAKLEVAIAALKQANGSTPKRKPAAKPDNPRLSAKGRAAISKAAKRRWAKYRKGQRS